MLQNSSSSSSEWDVFSHSTLDCKTVRTFAYSSTREQSNKRSRTRLKTTEAKGGPDSDFVFIFHFSVFIFYVSVFVCYFAVFVSNVFIFTSSFCFSVLVLVFILSFSDFVFNVLIFISVHGGFNPYTWFVPSGHHPLLIGCFYQKRWIWQVLRIQVSFFIISLDLRFIN